MYRTLILNQAYLPHDVSPWQDAVAAMFKGSVKVLAQYDEVLTTISRQTLVSFPELRQALFDLIGTETESLTIKVPAVVVLNRRVRMTKTGVKFSKINVALRDGFKCCYCGEKLPLSRLNYDHVVPRSQGGKTVWENIVMACYPCNARKDNHTPEQAGMALLQAPVRPAVLPMHAPLIDQSRAPEEWLPFLRQAS